MEKTSTGNDFISEYDLHLLAEGTHYRSWEKLGRQYTVNSLAMMAFRLQQGD
jgi:hypothetical protein